mmetsp:Transcript_31118/g.48122  ORF Transcript_31118/g.48122 Transcript_31118/m.48122 type:complete len:128 (+) Transcript_31118:167-550(+)
MARQKAKPFGPTLGSSAPSSTSREWRRKRKGREEASDKREREREQRACEERIAKTSLCAMRTSACAMHRHAPEDEEREAKEGEERERAKSKREKGKKARAHEEKGERGRAEGGGVALPKTDCLDLVL